MNSIHISVKDQLMTLLDEAGQVLHSYPVSTSKFGTGSQNNSNQTPLGLHRIKDKIGGAMPINEVYIARMPHGSLEECIERGVELPEDVITSRIMWLEGMQPGRNQGGYVDTYQRYIYIHGTSDEEHIGTPASMGCIRMLNADIVELFRLVESGTEVMIEE
ncbi:MAG: L,D-transpeptidase [Gammaproteobacteria bacterium]